MVQHFHLSSYSLNGFYSKSDGAAAFTPTGLVPIPNRIAAVAIRAGFDHPVRIKAWGVNASTVVMRRLTLSAGYAEAAAARSIRC